MKTVTTFPRPVREIMTAWIPMSDGCQLAARIWLPEDALQHPVPAVLEYLPYRRRDGTALRDSVTYPYLAGHGFAGIRVDIRGTGDSEGLILDEYDHAELDDGKEVIAWIASQPWCTGNVGMWGISWGGFNALQVAALAPPALKAIITLCSTDDRYHGDCHFMGGCLIDGNMGWGNQFFSNTARPPDPAVVGERWREMWLERLGAMNLSIATWLGHQRRDEYWEHGSVCADYSRIKAAVYAVGGWADGYTNSIFTMLRGLPGPKKALIGPWAHAYPHVATPGPAIGFLQEAMRWWDHWLNGNDTGIMAEPMVRAWMQESVQPAVSYDEWPGRWVAETAWPSRGITPVSYALNDCTIDETPATEVELKVSSPQAAGLDAASWCPYGLGPDMSGDQQGEDGMSLCFDSAPLAERVEILGAPMVELELESDKPQAQVAVRLCDVSPEGSSLRVSYGLLNLSHRDGSASPRPLEPNKRYRVRIQLCEAGHAFPAGHRMRIGVSTSYWPIAWPSPEPVILTVYAGASLLELPLRAPNAASDATLAPFEPPEGAAPVPHREIRPARAVELGDRIERVASTGEIRIVRRRDRGATYFEDIDLAYDLSGWRVSRIVEGQPLTASDEVTMSQSLEREGRWKVRSDTRTSLTATKDAFILTGEVNAYEDDVRIFSRSWNHRFARDYL